MIAAPAGAQNPAYKSTVKRMTMTNGKGRTKTAPNGRTKTVPNSPENISPHPHRGKDNGKQETRGGADKACPRSEDFKGGGISPPETI